MKLSVKPAVLKYLALGAGGAGLVLRALLYALAVDEEGLLAPNHPLGILLWVLTVGVLAALFLLSRNITGPEQYQDSFQPTTPGGIGCVLAAAGILITAIGDSSAADRIGLFCAILGYAAAVILLLLGLCRMGGYTPNFLLPTMVCLYFAVRMVCQYRCWSSDPQLQDYCFQLLACVALMLTAYQHAAFGAEMGSHKQLWLFSLSSVYLCCLSLAGPEDHLFYLGTGIWAFTNLTSLTARKRRQRPNLKLEEEQPSEEE